MDVSSHLGGTHEGAVKSVTEQKDGSVATRGERRGEERGREKRREGEGREQAETASQTFAKEMQSVK
jgi:hypothetical protein